MRKSNVNTLQTISNGEDKKKDDALNKRLEKMEENIDVLIKSMEKLALLVPDLAKKVEGVDKMNDQIKQLKTEMKDVKIYVKSGDNLHEWMVDESKKPLDEESHDVTIERMNEFQNKRKKRAGDIRFQK